MKLFSVFYLFLACFYILSLSLFSTRLVIFSITMGEVISLIIHCIFIFFLLVLYILAKRRKRIAFWLALVFHTFFLVNCLVTFSADFTFLALKGVYPAKETLLVDIFLILAVIVNLIIIIYWVYNYLFLRKY